MVTQAIVAYIIAMIIMNGQETAKLKKDVEANKSVIQCQSERAEDCQEKK